MAGEALGDCCIACWNVRILPKSRVEFSELATVVPVIDWRRVLLVTRGFFAKN